MGILKYDIEGMISKAQPMLSKSCKYLSNTSNMINSLNVPSKFKKKDNLKSILGGFGGINDISRNLLDVKKWLDNMIEAFKNADSSTKNVVDSILYGNYGAKLARNISRRFNEQQKT